MRRMALILPVAALMSLFTVAAQEEEPRVKAREPSRVTVRDKAEQVAVSESKTEDRAEPVNFFRRVGRAVIAGPVKFVNWMLADDQTVERTREKKEGASK